MQIGPNIGVVDSRLRLCNLETGNPVPSDETRVPNSQSWSSGSGSGGQNNNRKSLPMMNWQVEMNSMMHLLAPPDPICIISDSIRTE
jgi:hypothetical protein